MNSLTTKKWSWLMYGALVLSLGAGSIGLAKLNDPAPKLGDPIPGLTPEQLKLFNQTRDNFKHDFTPSEGLGPTFNQRSCYECHGKPGAVGGDGRDTTTTSVTHIGKRIGAKASKPLKDVICELREPDVDRLSQYGGPALKKKSVTKEFAKQFPPGVTVEPGIVPKEADLVGTRHTGPVFGLGLVDAVPDDFFVKLEAEQKKKYPKLAGRVAYQFDPLVDKKRPGRFGYKNQYATVVGFSAEAMRGEMGLSSSLLPYVHLAKQELPYPPALAKHLPPAPNDNGKVIIGLTYFEALLAAPPHGAVTEETKRGEKTFEKLQCAVCHTPSMQTDTKVMVPDPNSPAPKIKWMEVKAMEKQVIRPYADFLLHQMGPELADGMPQLGSKGGEWRTTPLWWLSAKKFYLHDGRAKTIEEAILAHGGQSADATQNFKKLKDSEKKDLMAFLKSI
jgi:CxxC motif-containing protein (DUF1111 family)